LVVVVVQGVWQELYKMGLMVLLEEGHLGII
jgi:hypothetical protein